MKKGKFGIPAPVKIKVPKYPQNWTNAEKLKTFAEKTEESPAIVKIYAIIVKIRKIITEKQ